MAKTKNDTYWKKQQEKHAEYWRQREEEQLKHNITEEEEYTKQLNAIYQRMLDNCQKEIDAFYGRYAAKEGITIAEAKKRVSKLDIASYERKAKRYVREKDFSAEANEEMRLYNLTMKVNRLEMLKANIGLEMIAGYDELQKYMDEILQGRTEDELKRQAGILGKTVRNNAKTANSIVNASFHNATFSERIWTHQKLLKADLDKLLQSGMIQGKNPRVLARDVEKRFAVRRSDAERLMKTELARVQTDAQKKSFEANDFDEYIFIVNSKCCPICEAINKKHFKVIDMLPGKNAPPMHPNCRCSIAAYEDSEDYESWLDFLENGGTTEEYNKLKAAGKPIVKKTAAKKKNVASKATKQKTKDDKIKTGKLDTNNFPAAFNQKAEKKITQKLAEYVNNLKNPSESVLRLFNKMGKMESIESQGKPFKISHAKKHAVQTTSRYSGELVEAKLIIPKLTGDNIAGQVNTMLHEEMHLMDLYLRKNKKSGGGRFCENRTSLVDVFNNTSSNMSDDIKMLFNDFKSEYKKTSETIQKKYSDKRAALRDSYFPDGASIWGDYKKYKQYEKEAKKLQTQMYDELDYECRNLMGGGVGNLQDIYDALSSGVYRDNGTVIYGHGSKYYVYDSAKIRETIANYGSLAITRPDLIEMLKADKPELVAELEATIEAMIKEAGE